jgi:hypothetical protein
MKIILKHIYFLTLIIVDSPRTNGSSNSVVIGKLHCATIFRLTFNNKTQTKYAYIIYLIYM